MYSIRIRTNYRLDEFRHGDRTLVGVRLKNGRIRFCHWRGFTLDVIHPLKTVVEAFTIESDWNPRNPDSRMPNWTQLAPGEYLLGSWSGGFIYTVLPFRIIGALERSRGHKNDTN